ncbi:PREDICTED: HERV-H LTR-associating protein 2 [Condylura cristata]|uniref:HERV-H LTR-associating protein 2 n=1 Tax=Condylura cristata TaxID=143302 RepID=UPI000643943A|nr:PREDICTED: HERV-H LTR-associating protein 2 [Condylura cristata]
MPGASVVGTQRGDSDAVQKLGFSRVATSTKSIHSGSITHDCCETGSAVFLHVYALSKYILRRLSRKDEGTYSCYVGTTSGKFRKSVVLQVGAFVTPVMKYEKRDTSSMLICSILSVYPRPSITWHMDNISITDSRVEEIGSLGSFHINSTVNVTGSKSPYECAIKNSLLEQTWTGHWMMKDDLHKMQSEQVSFSCDVANNLFQQNQDIIVTWSRMENGTSFILAKFESASQNIVTNEPRLSWEKELINQGHFSSTLKELEILDNGEYLCHISSSNYTFLTLQTLHVGKLTIGLANGF